MVSHMCAAQTLLEGRVVDAANGEPMLGVTVYISGSSRGTSTDADGRFSINYPEDYVAPLIFSYVGYSKVTIGNPQTTDLSEIRMTVMEDELEEVVLDLDPWSREKKEKYFKDFFLGSVPAAKLCEIRNLDKVRLRFNPAYNTLYAACDTPIIVDNKLLGYTIEVDMSDFEVIFEELNPPKELTLMIPENIKVQRYHPYSAFMMVSTYFRELESRRPSKRKRARNRRRLQKISVERFYKSLINENLDDFYYLTFNRKLIKPKDHIRVREYGDILMVEFRELKYGIQDKEGGESFIQLNAHKIPFTKKGVLLSKRDLLLGGFLGKLKLSGMLPLDYNSEE